MYACMYVCIITIIIEIDIVILHIEFKSGLDLSVNNLCYDDHYTVYLTHHKILPYAK